MGGRGWGGEVNKEGVVQEQVLAARRRQRRRAAAVAAEHATRSPCSAAASSPLQHWQLSPWHHSTPGIERTQQARTWLLAVGTSMLPMKMEWDRAKLWFSGLVRSNRRPSNRSGFQRHCVAERVADWSAARRQRAAAGGGRGRW